MSSPEPVSLDLQSIRPFLDMIAGPEEMPFTLEGPDAEGHPITANGRIVARLQAPGASAEQIETWASMIGWAADRQLTVADLTRQSARLWQELNFFHRMSRRLDEMPDPETAMPALLEALVRLLGSRSGWIILTQPEERRWAQGGEPEPPGLLALAQAVQTTGTGLALTRLDQWPTALEPESAAQLAAVFPLVLAPLVDAGQLLGVVAIARPNKGVPYSSFAVKLLYTSAAMAIGVIRRERMVRQAQAAAEHRRELEVARSIQLALRPRRPLDSQGVTAWGWCREATVVGGDLYGWWHGEGGPTWCYVGDVSGHGVGAALFMSNAHAILRALCAEEYSPAVVADYLNDLLHEDIAQSGQYLTLSLMRFDPTSRRLHHVGLGHPPLLFLSLEADQPESLEGEGLPAGLFPGAQNVEAERVVASGDLVLAYTDGITECESASGEAFGVERLSALLVKYRGDSLEAIGAAILAELEAFTCSAAPADDQTLMLVRF